MLFFMFHLYGLPAGNDHMSRFNVTMGIGIDYVFLIALYHGLDIRLEDLLDKGLVCAKCTGINRYTLPKIYVLYLSYRRSFHACCECSLVQMFRSVTARLCYFIRLMVLMAQ